MKYTKQDVLRLVQEEDVEFIRLQFTDIFGTKVLCGSRSQTCIFIRIWIR